MSLPAVDGDVLTHDTGVSNGMGGSFPIGTVISAGGDGIGNTTSGETTSGNTTITPTVTPTTTTPTPTTTPTTPITFGEVIRALDAFPFLTQSDDSKNDLGTLTTVGGGDNGNSKIFVLVLVVASIIGGIWFYQRRKRNV